jgi:hypothetical protein
MRADLSDITMVVDRSGSMASIAQETIDGMKVFINKQKEVPGECRISLVQFDDIIEQVFTDKKLAEVSEIPLHPRNRTALLDAIGKAITWTGERLKTIADADRPSRVMLVIVTDGMENASEKYDRDEIFQMIKHQTEVYKWDFVFLGANQDAIATATQMGINAAAAISYAATPTGARNVWAVTGQQVNTARTTGRAMANVGYSQQQREQAMDEDHKPKTTSSTK